MEPAAPVVPAVPAAPAFAPRWRTIVAVAAVALIAVYISYYYRAPPGISILQTSLADFRLEMLYEKQPIVIQDRVGDVADLQRAWFPRTRRLATVGVGLPPAEQWRRNAFKVLLIQPTAAPVEIYLHRGALTGPERAPPPDATLVAIQLAPHQVLMIPYRMAYATASGAPEAATQAAAIGVHDVVTYVLPKAA